MNQMVEHGIAIIGVSGRFPGAKNIETFWDNILQGKDSITSFSKEKLIDAGIPQEKLQSTGYVKSRGILEDVEYFDADFFGISPHEARLMDPQHRLFLECSFEALENAGYCSNHYLGTIGVFGGTARSTYFLHHLYPHPHLTDVTENYLIRTGNEQDFLTTRVSYKLNLKGPSLAIQTACSTSLVSICVACNNLLTYQCDIALAGGVSIFLPQQSGYTHQEGMIFSPNGHCNPFDTNAQGTVPSNGVGIVVLKRLEDAVSDGDHIYAVIRGYGLNNDGAEKVGYPAPSISGQATAIESAIIMAGIDPATISYAEAHGTATPLGDPIEIKALTKAFRQFTHDQRYCAIGSVKGNIGHCMEAAGIAGFIKTVCALQAKKIPPTIHFSSLNPKIDLTNSPFYVNTSLKDWPQGAIPRRACVSSFGIGGTNAHIVLEEAPTPSISEESNSPQLLILSAKTESALNAIECNLGLFLKEDSTISLEDVAYTLQVGRKEFEHRRFIVCNSREEAIAALLKQDTKISKTPTPEEKRLAEIGNLWATGAAINWPIPHPTLNKKPSRIPLPTYPFEKKRHWIDPPIETNAIQSTAPAVKKGLSIPDIEKVLHLIWEQFLGVKTVNANEDFFALGGDSLMAIQVISQIHAELGISLKLQTLYQFPTIFQLAIAISGQTNDISCLVPLRAGDECEQPPLYFVHGIDGNVFSFKPLAEAMTFQGPIFGIQANSSDQNELKIEGIAFSYINEIYKIQPKGPYFLCGSSFGGIIVYEMARQLKEAGHAVGFLGIMDAIHPQCDLLPQNNNLEMLAFLAELLEGKEVPVSVLQNLSKESLVERLLKSMGLHALPKLQKQKIFGQIQTFLKALKDYTPGPYCGEVTFFQAKDRFFRMKDTFLAKGWEPLINGDLVVVDVPGNHQTMLKIPNIDNLARQLDLLLGKVPSIRPCVKI